MKFLRLRLNRPQVTRHDSTMRGLARRRTPGCRVNTQLDDRDKNPAVVHNVGASQRRDLRRDRSANGRVRVVRL
jgi:hypothetical protein